MKRLIHVLVVVVLQSCGSATALDSGVPDAGGDAGSQDGGTPCSLSFVGGAGVNFLFRADVSVPNSNVEATGLMCGQLMHQDVFSQCDQPIMVNVSVVSIGDAGVPSVHFATDCAGSSLIPECVLGSNTCTFAVDPSHRNRSVAALVQ